MGFRRANFDPGGITLDFPMRYLVEAQSVGAITDRVVRDHSERNQTKKDRSARVVRPKLVPRNS
jgi:hypothetical protein